MTYYKGFRIDGNTVWVEVQEQIIEVKVFLPTNEMFEDFVKRTGIDVEVLKFGNVKQLST